MNPIVVRDRKNYVHKCQNETQTGPSSQHPANIAGQHPGAHPGQRLCLKTGEQGSAEEALR